MKKLIALISLLVFPAFAQTMPMPVFCMPTAVANSINERDGWVAQESGLDVDGDEWVRFSKQGGDWAILLYLKKADTVCAIGVGTNWKGKKGI